MKKVKIKIEGMHCASCTMLIDGDLEDLNGVKSSSTSFAKSETEVEYDESCVSLKEITNAIKKSGYKVI